jgi:hypothetical protein
MLAWMITRFIVFIPLGMRHTHRKYDLNVLISVTLSSIKNEFCYIEHFMSTSVIGGGTYEDGDGSDAQSDVVCAQSQLLAARGI